MDWNNVASLYVDHIEKPTDRKYIYGKYNRAVSIHWLQTSIYFLRCCPPTYSIHKSIAQKASLVACKTYTRQSVLLHRQIQCGLVKNSLLLSFRYSFKRFSNRTSRVLCIFALLVSCYKFKRCSSELECRCDRFISFKRVNNIEIFRNCILTDFS